MKRLLFAVVFLLLLGYFLPTVASAEQVLGAIPITMTNKEIQSAIWLPVDLRLFDSKGGKIGFAGSDNPEATILVLSEDEIEICITTVGLERVDKVEMGFAGLVNSSGNGGDWHPMTMIGAQKYSIRVKTKMMRWGKNHILFKVYHKDNRRNIGFIVFILSFNYAGRLNTAYVINAQEAPVDYEQMTPREKFLYTRGFFPPIGQPVSPELANQFKLEREGKTIQTTNSIPTPAPTIEKKPEPSPVMVQVTKNPEVIKQPVIEPLKVEYSVNPNEIQEGECVHAKWTVSNSKFVGLDGSEVAEVGERYIKFEKSGSIQFLVVGKDGNVFKRRIDIKVNPKPTPPPPPPPSEPCRRVEPPKAIEPAPIPAPTVKIKTGRVEVRLFKDRACTIPTCSQGVAVYVDGNSILEHRPTNIGFAIPQAPTGTLTLDLTDGPWFINTEKSGGSTFQVMEGQTTRVYLYNKR